MVIQQARMISLEKVQGFFNLKEHFNYSFDSLLSLEPLTSFEQQELTEIRDDFRRYVSSGKVSEGQVKFLIVAPLMRLAGFYKAPLVIMLEEDIADIIIAEEDITIKGRMDILAVRRSSPKNDDTPFSVLVVEAKNSEIAALSGLPQLLTYCCQNLGAQAGVWGLVTNGVTYQFVYLEDGNYQLFPDLSIIDKNRSVQLLQILKAICNSISIVR
jgi:hypothetical protein